MDHADEHADQQHPLHGRAALANEIADIVEQRIWGKIAKWLVFNIGALLLSIATGIAAYYSLESRVNHIQAIDNLTARQMDAMGLEHSAIKSALQMELRDINSRLDEINRYLRDKNGVINDRARNP